MFRKDITPDFSTYTLLVSWLCLNGRIAQSCLFLEEMVLKGFAPRQETFDLVLDRLGKRNLLSAKRKVQLLRMQITATRSTAPYLGETGDIRHNCAILTNVSGAEFLNR
jgi:pentatricopeptide repeat protein